MMSPARRVCPDCGDRALLYPRTQGDRTRMLSGRRLCAGCHAERQRKPGVPPPQPRQPDEVVVERLIAGRRVEATIDDRIEVVRRKPWTPAAELATMLGVSSRTITRYRREIRA